ncbi:unnamed protein product [Ambrosiozyma monospora]|uniref:Unnamed protein product n=1 Tax=Ambrosiozyma monospora TaxID=43982 RepID=A0ACB5T7G3_AMBMO|nr:unnamed protein product [Ambrosiozyma monospora]
MTQPNTPKVKLQNRPTTTTSTTTTTTTTANTNKTTRLQTNKAGEIIITKAQRHQIKGYQRIVAGLLFLIVPSVEIYRRLYLDEERKIQQGLFNPQDGTIREFDEEEKVKNFKNSWFTRIFGEK